MQIANWYLISRFSRLQKNRKNKDPAKLNNTSIENSNHRKKIKVVKIYTEH